jgi:predicted nucleic acid-binding protein
MVAAVCTWHERHLAATGEIERRLARGETLAVAAHALTEAYAVLTRLPAPHRLAPADAWALVEANFVTQATVVTLEAAAYTGLLRQLASNGIGGGRVYDAVIGACASLAAVGTILTFNPRHFEPPPRGVAVVEPSDPPAL